MNWRDVPLPPPPQKGNSYLPFGNGRSYGDSCLNSDGFLIDGRGLDRFIRFDPERGALRCEAGVLLSEILGLVVPLGWFLPVTPGTRYVTLGGAIANDVHGKNHHGAGTFGNHLRCFELLRSDGSRRLCSPRENPDWFAATIGGLGLTGMITWAEIQLKPIKGPCIRQESVRYDDLDGFFRLADESDQHYEYTVAWVDCLASGSRLGRGHFIRGRHGDEEAGDCPPAGKHLSVPFTLPVTPLNRWTLKGFNSLYFHKQRHGIKSSLLHYGPFFYPLDGIGHWNRLYGPKGFLQYQCVVPRKGAKETIRRLLSRISAAGTGSFLAVLKRFGDLPSPGMLSFPRPGVTLALDFSYKGKETLALLDCLDRIVMEAGGALYPAKDARMGAEIFQRAYPRWRAFRAFVDPQFSSDLWRRVAEETP